MPDNNNSVFENRGPNKLFDLYEQEINVEENELEKDLYELFEESNKRYQSDALT